MRAPGRAIGLLAVLLAGCAGAACSGDATGPEAGPPAGTSSGVWARHGVAGASTVATGTGTPAVRGGTPDAGPTRVGAATAPPPWLGKRALPVGPNGFAVAQGTPPELRERSIITADELPPPADGRFHATVRAVPARVLARSTWTSRCPVARSQLRYVTVGFRGFDGRAHTGELLVNARVADQLVTVFARLFAAGFPIERMRITSTAELDARPTGDGNTTGVFVCRPVRGQTSWSQHAYGLAVDLDPFQNPYHSGDVVLPELAGAYLDRSDRRPGMVLPDGSAVRGFAAIGWRWGGDYRSLKDYMHFSASGG